jgi:hypothetical protein
VKTSKRQPSINKKQIKKSFNSTKMENQLASKHKENKKVVKTIKNTEIPSIPKEKFKLVSGIHKKSQTN